MSEPPIISSAYLVACCFEPKKLHSCNVLHPTLTAALVGLIIKLKPEVKTRPSSFYGIQESGAVIQKKEARNLENLLSSTRIPRFWERLTQWVTFHNANLNYLEYLTLNTVLRRVADDDITTELST
jgi:hypothetical protein